MLFVICLVTIVVIMTIIERWRENKSDNDNFYYYAYNFSVDELCKRIDTNLFTCGLQDNIDSENDILLIHAMFQIVRTTDLYRKRDIKDELWGKIQPYCIIDERPYSNRGNMKYFQDGYEKLFDFCWRQNFGIKKNGKDSVKFAKIAYSNRTPLNKLINNNYCIALFLIAFLFIQRAINDSFFLLETEDTLDIILLHIVVFIVSLFTTAAIGGAGNRSNPNAFYLFPIIAIIIFCIIDVSIMFDDSYTSTFGQMHAEEKMDLMKRNILMGLSYLLWYPIIFINIERLDDMSSR